ncbi:MAG: response regulator transcription factor [Clostridia bacterium]|nr:response regulator transcription factor [Clostridia bacterium]
MQLKIAIVDDNALQREHLRGITAAWSERNHHLTQLREYPSAEAFLFAFEEEGDFDLLLLDVEMPGMSGVELAKAIRKTNHTLQIVFVTAYYEYFSDGFDVSALHYLIKPVDGGKLWPVLDRACQNLAYRLRSVLISTADGDVKVPLGDILYVEAQNVHLLIHTPGEVFRTRMTLLAMSRELDETFFKIHRSFIVSLKYVRKITRSDVTMVNGDILPLSRGSYDAVHAALIRYL